MNEHCQYCHKPIGQSVHPYTLRLQLFPAIEPSLQISESDMAIDFEKEMKRLIETMEAMDDAQVREEEKKMYLAFSFTLCPKCRDRLARQLEHLRPHPHGQS